MIIGFVGFGEAAAAIAEGLHEDLLRRHAE